MTGLGLVTHITQGSAEPFFYALKIAYINFMMYLCSEVIIKEVDQNE
jgi:hypothetical protein